MKRFWTAVAVAGFAFGLLAGCNDYNNSIQYNTGATLTNVAPNGLPAGTGSFLLTVNASQFNGFNSTTVVQWNGQKLASTFVDPTTMTATVPSNLLAKPGTALVNTLTAQSGTGRNGPCNDPSCLPLVGGGNSNPFSFLIGGGAPAAAIAEETPAISQDGRYVVYGSQQSQVNQILLKDTCVGISSGCSVNTRVVSVAVDGAAGNADSHNAVVTPDGRYVAFSSAATNLVEGAAAGRQVYVHDTCIGAETSCKLATTLISTDSQGALNGTESVLPSINSTGRYVAFVAITPSNAPRIPGGAAANVQAAPNSGLRQVFVRDTCLGATDCTPKTTRISMMPGDAPGNGTKTAGPAGRR